MNRRNFIRLLGGGLVLAAAPSLTSCSSELPSKAIAAWKGPENETDIRKWILSYAILAPHSHNLQSWLVDLRRPQEIILYCDMNRLLPETDPYSRQIMMSHGTFLELLELAAIERGLRATIELFPEGEFAPEKIDNRPVAHIRLSADATVKKDPLFSNVLSRRTNRESYEMRDIPEEAFRDIEASVATYPIRLGRVGINEPDLLDRHRAIAAEAWRIEMITPRTIMESYRLLRVGPDEIAKYRDGISINKPILRFLVATGLFDRSKVPSPDDSGIKGQVEDFNTKLEKTPAFFWMISEGNGRKTQIIAGRAYVRAQLAATKHGLSMQPISQALQEYPEQAKPYSQIHQLLDAPVPRYTVQMWARLGYAPIIGPSPRRGLSEHFVS
jgi:hypothetical protein